jgi:hypothetical protein
MICHPKRFFVQLWFRTWEARARAQPHVSMYKICIYELGRRVGDGVGISNAQVRSSK